MVDTITDPEMRAAVASELVSRMQAGWAMGLTFDGRRDAYAIYGYKRDLTVADYLERYERGGIAGTIVEALPHATWRGGVELIEDDDAKKLTPLEAAWDAFEEKHKVSSRLMGVDILSRLSTFAVLFIGAPGEVNTELPRGQGTTQSIVFLSSAIGDGAYRSQAASQREAIRAGTGGVEWATASIASWETDDTSERFGQPKSYRVTMPAVPGADFGKTFSKEVHWSRVIHVAEGGDVFGAPALKRPWNLLDDLEKCTAGGSEAYFQRANQGRLWSIDKDVKLGAGPAADAAKQQMRDEIEKFQHNITRDVRLQGVEVTSLGSDTSQFGPNADAVLTQLAGTVRMPKRILTGSEMGELASSQDRDNWRDQVNGRREMHAGPYVLQRLADRLIAFNYLPTPVSYRPRWGTVLNLTEDERRAKATAWATVNAQLKAAGQPIAFLSSEIRDLCYEMAPLTAADIAAEAAMMPATPAAEPTLTVAEDATLVEQLATAIDANDTATIHALIGVTHA